MPADDLQADRPVRAVSGRGDVAEPGRGGAFRRPAATAVGERASVRLSRPATPAAIDEPLSERMALVREIVSLGRSARMGAKLKVRQPLAQVEVVLADTHASGVARRARRADLRRTERQAGRVHRKAEQYITYTVLPDLKRLGPRLGKRLPAVQKAAGRGRRRHAAGRIGSRGQRHARPARRPGRARLATTSKSACRPRKAGPPPKGTSCVVVLSTELTDELDRRRARPRAGPRHPGPPQGDGLPVHRSDRRGHRDRLGRAASRRLEQFADYIQRRNAGRRADARTCCRRRGVDRRRWIGRTSRDAVPPKWCETASAASNAKSLSHRRADLRRRHDAAEPDREDRRRPAARRDRPGDFQQSGGRRSADRPGGRHPARGRRAARASRRRTISAARSSSAAARRSADLVVMGGFLKRLTIPADFANRVVEHPSRLDSRVLRRRVLRPSRPRGRARSTARSSAAARSTSPTTSTTTAR